MKYISLCLLLLVVTFATGCPNRPSTSFNNKNTFVSNVNDYLAKAQLDYNAVVDTNPAKAKRIRNEAIEDAVAVIDDNYSDFISHIETSRSKMDFLADVIDLGTSGAVGISKGERSLHILGVALTAFRGGRKSADLNFYKQQTTPILIAKMDDNRSKAYADMLQGKSKGVDEYSLKEAIRDMVGYYNAGTLVRAFTELSKDTAAQAKDSSEKVRRIKGLKSLDSIPPIEITKPSEQVFAQLRDLDAQLNGASTKDKAAKRLDLIYRFILSDAGFKETVAKLKSDIETLGVPRKEVVKAALTKIDAGQNLDSNEAYWYVYAIYNITHDNVEMTTRLSDVFVKVKPE
jgi:hypothetical protein